MAGSPAPRIHAIAGGTQWGVGPRLGTDVTERSRSPGGVCALLPQVRKTFALGECVARAVAGAPRRWSCQFRKDGIDFAFQKRFVQIETL